MRLSRSENIDEIVEALKLDIIAFILNRRHKHAKMNAFDIEADFTHDILKIKFKPIK